MIEPNSLDPDVERPQVYSDQQQAIIRAYREHDGNFVVVARAGTGKTTMLLAGNQHAPERKKLVCAFSKIIADELNFRIKRDGLQNVEARTLHSVGYKFILEKQNWPGVRPTFTSERADALALKVCGGLVPTEVLKLVAKLHTKGREMAPHATSVGDLTDIALEFECEPDEGVVSKGYDLTYIEQKALDAMEQAAALKPVDGQIDFSDMIFLPVRKGWLRPTWDLVSVDEAQDMTTSQLEIAQGACSGRIAVIGDPCQAIFGFRGADSNSLYRLKQELNAIELPLTVTYRCGKAIVREAQRLVPDFEAAPSNPEGEVAYLSREKLLPALQPGDFLLSRVNAPLVSVAMGLLKQGKRTVIAGRDIGKGLQTLITKLNAKSVPDLMQKIGQWEQREIDKLTKRFQMRPAVLEQRIEAAQDQADMLTSLAEDARSVNEVIGNLAALFQDKGSADTVVTCSSVHRAKGLEAKRVFVLADTLRSNSQEENNITYVAITRAKSLLTYVVQAE